MSKTYDVAVEVTVLTVIYGIEAGTEEEAIGVGEREARKAASDEVVSVRGEIYK